MTKEPRVNVNLLREAVVKAGYEWREAEVKQELCVLTLNEGMGLAARRVQRAESTLRITVDALYREEKSLGLI
jgi:hypothetical protein